MSMAILLFVVLGALGAWSIFSGLHVFLYGVWMLVRNSLSR